MSGSGVPIFDFHTVSQRRARARRIAGDRFLDRAAAEGLAERFGAVNRRFENALALDTSADALELLKPGAERWSEASLDIREMLPAEPGSYDLAVSVLSLHAVNDLPGVLIQIRRALKPDGLFLAALFGGATLAELRDSFAMGESLTLGGLSPRVAPFADVRDLGGLLQRAGFALPVADVERILVRYRDFSGLLRDLRAHGQTNPLAARHKAFLRRDTLAAALSHYKECHAENGRLKTTFDIVYLTGWAPHESQQQPLRPGSAAARLAEALGVAEQPAGEKVPSTGNPATRC